MPDERIGHRDPPYVEEAFAAPQRFSADVSRCFREHNRYRVALEDIEAMLTRFVEGGEPAAEDAADVLERVRRVLRAES